MWLPGAGSEEDPDEATGATAGRVAGGLGVAPDEQAIARYRVETIEAVGQP